jgi:hypothetical protein
MWRNSWLAGEILTSQEELCFMASVTYSLNLNDLKNYVNIVNYYENLHSVGTTQRWYWQVKTAGEFSM